MNLKSLALAAAMLALPVAVAAPIFGGAAHAIAVGGGGSSSAGASDNGIGSAETGVAAASCVPRNYNSVSQMMLNRNEGCKKSVSIVIGRYRLI